MTATEAYNRLLFLSKEIALLNSCSSVLHWEEQTYMPPGGIEHRGNQSALLAGMTHEKRTDPQFGDLLSALEQTDLIADPLSAPAVNVREWRRSFDRATKVPKSLVEEIAKTTALAQRQWVDARKKDRFADFEPWLDKVVLLKRREAKAIGYDAAPYDALLDEYEPGAKTDRITEVFANLRDELVPIVRSIAESPRKPDTDILHREYPVERQRVFGEMAAAALGFDFTKGRLDSTAHPFCSSFGPGDCRITTRYNPRFFNESFFGTLHETGHALYEQGLDPDHYGSALGEAVSLGIHESQSRLWENQVGRSKSFWRRFFPLAQQVFREALGDVSLDRFHFAVNAVEPSLIRVEADEVTYNLHVLIRFELEQALISGDLQASEVPEAWNAKYEKYLGIKPPNDALGCLQDIHWSAGLFGYFPTYTLGNLFGAQLFATAREQLGDLDEAFAKGEFQPLREWLRENVHRQGCRYWSNDLIHQVTGSAPTHLPLIASLRGRFGELYDIA